MIPFAFRSYPFAAPESLFKFSHDFQNPILKGSRNLQSHHSHSATPLCGMTIPCSTTLSGLTIQEREVITSIRNECANLFARRCSEVQSNVSLQIILGKMRQFIHSDDIEAQARRADACGILWTSKGIAVNTSRLHNLLGKGRTWINERLTRLGYISAGQESQEEVVLEIIKILGRERYDAKKSAHWTYRSTKVRSDDCQSEENDPSGKNDSWSSEFEDVGTYDPWDITDSSS
jgi:hypothetical protein